MHVKSAILINPPKKHKYPRQSDIINHCVANMSERTDKCQHMKKFWPIVNILISIWNRSRRRQRQCQPSDSTVIVQGAGDQKKPMW